jgi:hypothetical protein
MLGIVEVPRDHRMLVEPVDCHACVDERCDNLAEPVIPLPRLGVLEMSVAIGVVAMLIVVDST